MGARPLRRVIQNKIEDRLSDKMLAGEFKPGDHIVVEAEDSDVVLTRQETAPESVETLPAS
jgi:ATP-dependent Clp protease ATP-binding subunit ClpC